MITLICDNLARILKNRKKIEKELKVKISNKEKEIQIDGEPENEYFGERVIEALDFGFPFSIALCLKNHENDFEIIKIKDHTKRKDFSRIKGRIIGTKGKTLRTLSNLTECFFEIKDNCIGIIGDGEYIKNAREAIIHLIKGSKQANVYAYLEKHRPEPIFDLGLKRKGKD